MMITALHFQSINIFRVSAGWERENHVNMRIARKISCTPSLHFPIKLQFRPMWKILCLKYHHPLYLNTRTERIHQKHTLKRGSKLVRVCNHIILFIARHHQHLHSWTRGKSYSEGFMLLALMLMYNGKTHYFFMVQRGSVVFFQKRLLDGNKLIKKFYLFILSLTFLLWGLQQGLRNVNVLHRNSKDEGLQD